MKYLLVLLLVGTSVYGQVQPLENLPRSLFAAAPYRVDFWSECVAPFQTLQSNYHLLKSAEATDSDTVLLISLSTMYRDTIYFCRVPTELDSVLEPLRTPQGGMLPFVATTKPVAPSLDIAMKLEIALGQLADSLTLLEKKRTNCIKAGNKGMSLIGVGILLTGLCVGDLTDKYPNTSLQKTSLRAGIAAGSMMTAYGIFEVFRYLIRRNDFKSMETRLGSYTEGDIRRLMNTGRQ